MGLIDLLGNLFSRTPAPPQYVPQPEHEAAPVAGSEWLTLVLPLTKVSEGCVLKAYQDVGGVWTIGYGHTSRVGAPVTPGMVWTQEQADTELQTDLEYFGDLADRAITVAVSPAQKAAFVDLLFNVGPGMAGVHDGIIALKSGGPSTLLKLLNAGDMQGAANQFPAWDKAGGIVVGGLLARRLREKSLFLTGAWT